MGSKCFPVILEYCGGAATDALFASLTKWNPSHAIHVLDNASPHNRAKCITHSNAVNSFVGGGIKDCLSLAAAHGSESALLIVNDLEFLTPLYIDELERALRSDDRIVQIGVALTDDSPQARSYPWMARQMQQGLRRVPHCDIICCLLRLSFVDDLGGFPNSKGGWGYDLALADHALRTGKIVAISDSVLVKHRGDKRLSSFALGVGFDKRREMDRVFGARLRDHSRILNAEWARIKASGMRVSDRTEVAAVSAQPRTGRSVFLRRPHALPPPAVLVPGIEEECRRLWPKDADHDAIRTAVTLVYLQYAGGLDDAGAVDAWRNALKKIRYKGQNFLGEENANVDASAVARWRSIIGKMLEAPWGKNHELESIKLALTEILSVDDPGEKLARYFGVDWPERAATVVGMSRLNTLQMLAEGILDAGAQGDLVAFGVWRGGAALLLKAVLKTRHARDRVLWVADSFADGPLPPHVRRDPVTCDCRRGAAPANWGVLSVTEQEVADNFRRFHLLDDNVRIIRGRPAASLPARGMRAVSLLRIDAGMYEPTYMALERLYPLVSCGGYVIVDDYPYPGSCRAAVEAFRRERHITEVLRRADWAATYWRKDATKD